MVLWIFHNRRDDWFHQIPTYQDMKRHTKNWGFANSSCIAKKQTKNENERKRFVGFGQNSTSFGKLVRDLIFSNNEEHSTIASP